MASGGLYSGIYITIYNPKCFQCPKKELDNVKQELDNREWFETSCLRGEVNSASGKYILF